MLKNEISQIFSILTVLAAVFTVAIGGSGCSDPSKFPKANITDNPMDVAKKVHNAIMTNNREALESCLTSATSEDIDKLLKLFNSDEEISRMLKKEFEKIRFTKYTENGSSATVYFNSSDNGKTYQWEFKKIDSVWKLDFKSFF